MKILVTGANGQLGKCLQDLAKNYPSVDFYFADRLALPIDQQKQVEDFINALRPDLVINTAAYTAVDKAETEKEQAYLINGTAVGILSAICDKINARFIHVSTDYVFNGTASAPYVEEDEVSPVNAYGDSKLKGEQLAMANNALATIIRTSWVYSQHGNNFVKTMMRLMAQRERLGVVSDQVGCPTYAIDLAEALVTIGLTENYQPGIFHFSNTGPITWFDFAAAIAAEIRSACVVEPISTSAFPTPARRPAYSVLSNKKLESVYKIEQQDWETSLRKCIGLITAAATGKF